MNLNRFQIEHCLMSSVNRRRLIIFLKFKENFPAFQGNEKLEDSLR